MEDNEKQTDNFFKKRQSNTEKWKKVRDEKAKNYDENRRKNPRPKKNLRQQVVSEVKRKADEEARAKANEAAKRKSEIAKKKQIEEKQAKKNAQEKARYYKAYDPNSNEFVHYDTYNYEFPVNQNPITNDEVPMPQLSEWFGFRPDDAPKVEQKPFEDDGVWPAPENSKSDNNQNVAAALPQIDDNGRPLIVDEQKLKKMDEIEHQVDDDWTKPDETFDYNKKLSSDDEDDDPDENVGKRRRRPKNVPKYVKSKKPYVEDTKASASLNNKFALLDITNVNSRSKKDKKVIQKAHEALPLRAPPEHVYDKLSYMYALWYLAEKYDSYCLYDQYYRYAFPMMKSCIVVSITEKYQEYHFSKIRHVLIV